MNYYKCLAVLALIAIVSATQLQMASAQYPLLPTESVGNNNFEWRPELGGWRDKSSNLAWGYSVSDTVNSSYSYAFATTNASNYPQYLYDRASGLLAEAADLEQTGSQQTDPVRRQAYFDLAAVRRADAASTTLAANDANQYSNWRTPTLTEFQSAWSKGLFSRGPGLFNMDMTPFQGYQSGYGGLNWTSNPPSRNKKNATVFNITDGGSGSVGVNSSLRWIVVRNAQ